MLPHDYTHAHLYKMYDIRTNKGWKRTFAQSTQEARRKCEKRGLTVYAVIDKPKRR